MPYLSVNPSFDFKKLEDIGYTGEGMEYKQQYVISICLKSFGPLYGSTSTPNLVTLLGRSLLLYGRVNYHKKLALFYS